jgi:hypothetical protein
VRFQPERERRIEGKSGVAEAEPIREVATETVKLGRRPADVHDLDTDELFGKPG